MSNKEHLLCQQYIAILRNLLTNIHAIDFYTIYSEVNAVLIGLPRHSKSYQSKPWAYFAFKSEEAMNVAMAFASANDSKKKVTYANMASSLDQFIHNPNNNSNSNKGKSTTHKNDQPSLDCFALDKIFNTVTELNKKFNTL